MSLLLLFRSSVLPPPPPLTGSPGEGGRTFLHVPTTTNVPLSLSELIDIYLGDTQEIIYEFQEIRRRQLSIVMNQGEDVLVLPRLEYGKRCPFWQSEEEQCSRPLDSQTPCYNTGWIGGYSKPLTLKIVVPPADRMHIGYDVGVRTEYRLRPWTVHTPPLRERMLLIRRYSGLRYEILNVNEVRWRGLVMSQEFDLREMVRGAHGSYVYAVPVQAP